MFYLHLLILLFTDLIQVYLIQVDYFAQKYLRLSLFKLIIVAYVLSTPPPRSQVRRKS